MDGQKAVILAQVGHFHFGAVGQFSIGGDRIKRYFDHEPVRYAA